MAKRRIRLSRTALLRAYARGERHFWEIDLDGVRLSGARLTGASFLGSSLRNAKLDSAGLTHVQLKSADLTGADLSGAALNATDLIAANFSNANLRHADLTGAALNHANCSGADMRDVLLGNATLSEATLAGCRLDRAHLGDTHLGDLDVGPLCDAKRLSHSSPSPIDSRTVMKSYTHPGLKQLMLDCGVPAVFAEYMIDCARSLGLSLFSVMQSTFISYGDPDATFARKLYEALRAHDVVTFFFPETATLGERIDSEVYRRLQEFDRVILVCSRSSLDRRGVLNEIQETLNREARDGGATYLLPIMLDDYVLKGWRAKQPELAERVGRRIAGDFRGTRRSETKFNLAMSRLLDALKKKHPPTPSASPS